MQIIKERIKLTNIDTKIKVILHNNDFIFDEQLSLDKLLVSEVDKAINPIIDGDVTKYKLNLNNNVGTIIKFYFGDNNLSFETNGAGFTQNELNNKLLPVANSFFIMDFYDTYEYNKQKKIFTQYITKIGKIPEYSIGLVNGILSTKEQLYYWYVPNSYINESVDEIIVGYVKFSFYNAKFGKTILFYNDHVSNDEEKKMYFKAMLNRLDLTWKFETNIVVGRELLNSNMYVDRINNTFDLKNNIVQQYPQNSNGLIKKVFDYSTGKYI